MRRRSRAPLGPIVRGLLAAGLCALGAAAQQSATPAAPASSQAPTSTANDASQPATGTDQNQANTQSSAAETQGTTGVSNPDPVVPEAAPAADTNDSQSSATQAPSAAQPATAPQPATSDDAKASPSTAPADSKPADAANQPAAASQTVPADASATPGTPAAADVKTTTAPANAADTQPPAASTAAADTGAAGVTQTTPTTPPAAAGPPATQPSSPAPQSSPDANAPAAPTAAPATSTDTPAPQPAPPAPAPDATQTPAAAPASATDTPGAGSATPASNGSAPEVSTPAAQTPDATPAAATPPAEPPSTSEPSAAQDSQAVNPSMPAPQVNESEPPPASRVDIFAGYAYLRPSGSVGSFSFPNNNTRGYIASGTYYFKRHIGVQAEFSHSEYPLGTTGTSPAPPFVQLGGVTDSFYTVEGGPVYRFFLGQHIVPFVHVVGGGAKIAGPKFQPLTWGYGVSAGGGVDVLLPHTHDHVAFRLAQADYEYMHADQGALQQYDLAGGSQDVTALRLSAGLVFRFGEMNASLPKGLACDATPSEVYAGERVTLAANLRNYRNKNPFAFRWELSAGKQQGFGPVIFVDTTGLAAGTYHATAHISLKEKGKQFAQCSTNFIVKDSPAPTLKCSADPSTVTPGQTSTITAYATTIAQRQLSYSYTTSEGQIGGTDSTTQLHTDGLPPGMATVTCRVRDDLGQTAVATTEVTIAPPALPPAPKAQPLCTVYFNRDMRRPARVDNEGRACLDDVALTLEHQPDARLVLVGEHSDSETDGQLTAAERSINTRAYLANEKGIDPSRVDVRTSATPGRQVQTFLLAPGAIFDQPTEGRIDETKIPIHGQQYVNQRARQKGPVGHGVSRPPHN